MNWSPPRLEWLGTMAKTALSSRSGTPRFMCWLQVPRKWPWSSQRYQPKIESMILLQEKQSVLRSIQWLWIWYAQYDREKLQSRVWSICIYLRSNKHWSPWWKKYRYITTTSLPFKNLNAAGPPRCKRRKRRRLSRLPCAAGQRGRGACCSSRRSGRPGVRLWPRNFRWISGA